MKSIFRKLLSLAIVIGMACSSILVPTSAIAQTANYSPQTAGVVVIPLHISGQYTATTAGVVKFQLPFKVRVLSVQANARASGGTSPTLTVDVLNGATSMLSAPISITAGTVAFGTVATAVHADESTINVNLAITGTSPTWNDITVLITALRV